ncbi:MAG: hypothetical protein AAF193_12305 [Bacteroidota bacterium]
MMKNTLKMIGLIIFGLILTQCQSPEKSTNQMNPIVLEVTTFTINSNVDPTSFAKRDALVEADFTSQQNGFIRRQSGVDEKGQYVVLVYWESPEDADASMQKFMKDESVMDYASMINGPSMKMARFDMDQDFASSNTSFVEVMSFDVKEGTNMEMFDQVNQRVESEFTSKRKGFKQRLTGNNQEGKQVVAVYWQDKELSDASLEPFMSAPISKEFMGKMNQQSILMGRYQFLMD